MLSEEEKIRYSRQIILPGIGEQGQQKIKSARVLVVGAGGLGSPVLLYLAAAGIGTIGIIDGDNINLSNLHRQVLYNSNETGKSKSATAKEKINSLNPHVVVNVFNEQLTNSNALTIIQDYDIIVDGSDNFPTRYLVNDACVILNKPFVSGAVYRFEGQVSVFNYNNGPTYRCLFAESPQPGDSPDCSQAGVLGVLPGIIGCYQATEVIKIITGTGKVLSGKMMIINLLENTTTYFDIETISSNKKIKKLVNYHSFCGYHNTNSITAEELNKIIAAGEDFQLIDVREQQEYDKQNMGAQLIPLSILENNYTAIDRNKKVVIHCQSGKRSLQAIKILQETYQYNNLYNLEGGIEAWLVQKQNR